MDQLYLNKRIRIYRDIITHIKRAVPKLGHINVDIGEEVSPEDILGEGQIFSGFININLAKKLQINPTQAHIYLKRRIGQTIYQDELLAEREDLLGFRKKLIFSPIDGIVDSYNTDSGDLKLRILPRKTKLVSGVYGIVDYIDKKSGAISIRTKVNIINGVVGSGYEREGILNILGSREQLVSSKQILPDHRGQILVCGGLVFVDALRKALDVGVAGLISGGINAGDFATLADKDWNTTARIGADVGLSLLITEGFGSAPINEDIYVVLKKHHNKFVILNGNLAKLVLPTDQLGSMIDIRKAKAPVKIMGTSSAVEEVKLMVGSKVRVVSTMFLGTQGIVEAIDKTLTKLPSEVLTYMVTVKTPGGKLRIPYSNLEAT